MRPPQDRSVGSPAHFAGFRSARRPASRRSNRRRKSTSIPGGRERRRSPWPGSRRAGAPWSRRGRPPSGRLWGPRPGPTGRRSRSRRRELALPLTPRRTARGKRRGRRRRRPWPISAGECAWREFPRRAVAERKRSPPLCRPAVDPAQRRGGVSKVIALYVIVQYVRPPPPRRADGRSASAARRRSVRDRFSHPSL